MLRVYNSNVNRGVLETLVTCLNAEMISAVDLGCRTMCHCRIVLLFRFTAVVWRLRRWLHSLHKGDGRLWVSYSYN